MCNTRVECFGGRENKVDRPFGSKVFKKAYVENAPELGRDFEEERKAWGGVSSQAVSTCVTEGDSVYICLGDVIDRVPMCAHVFLDFQP